MKSWKTAQLKNLKVAPVSKPNPQSCLKTVRIIINGEADREVKIEDWGGEADFCKRNGILIKNVTGIEWLV